MKTPKCIEPGCRRYAEPNDNRCKTHGEAYLRYWEHERWIKGSGNGRRATPRNPDEA